MRVGRRPQGTTCRTVVLDGRTVVSAARELHAGSFSEPLESSLSGLRREFGSGITEITADVGRVLVERKLADAVAISISPRPPADDFHTTVLPALVEPAVTRTVYVSGGHDLRGRPLARLDLEAFLAELPGITVFQTTDRFAGVVGLAPAPRDSGKTSGNHRRPPRYDRRLLRVFCLSPFRR